MRGENTFKLFYLFTICLLILWHIYGFNQTLDRKLVGFIDGVSASVVRMLSAQIFIDFLVFTAKLYIAMLIHLAMDPAPVMANYKVWVVQPFLAI